MGAFGSNVRGVLATLLAAVGVCLVALAPAAAARSDVPFKARLSGTATFTSPSSVEFHGAGQATHLGRFTNGGIAILGPPTDGCPDGAQGIPAVHTETLVAANGDELVIRMVNVACPTGPASFRGTGRWTVTGGTGRFAHVTGAGSNEGNADFATNTFELTLRGTLSRP
jgi:hypothetical protein